jgi:hypothetical protein
VRFATLVVKRLALVLASSMVVFGLGEAGVRFHHWRKFGTSPFQSGLTGNLPLLRGGPWGWYATKNYHWIAQVKNSDGTSYETRVTTNDLGFRKYGDPLSTRPKILFLGDSFTAALAASDGAEYFSVAARDLGAEAFAYGAGGFGTLQEAMVLEENLDRIKPDLVVWQYCWNDFINNSYELEAASWESNNGLVRPYFADGKVYYAFPSRVPRLRLFALDHSRFLYFFTIRMDILMARRPGVEAEIAKRGRALPSFEKSVGVTSELMSRVKRRLGNTPLLTFSVDKRQPYERAFHDLSTVVGIRYTTAPSDAVEIVERTGKVLRNEDREHWNQEANEIAGHALAQEIKEERLLPLHP